VGTLGAPALAATPAPLHEAAALSHPWVAALVGLGGVVAMLGVVLSQLLGLSRMVFAMSRRGDLPRLFAHVDPRYGVPRRAVLIVGTLSALVAATGTLQYAASSAAFSILVYYGITNMAAFRMAAPAKLYRDLIPLFGLAACCVLAGALGRSSGLTGLMILLAGFAVRRVMVRIR
jgi:APA family basic amino acid/polyamine antiporter